MYHQLNKHAGAARAACASYLELLIDALQRINRGVESANLVALDLHLLLEILDLAAVGVAFRGVLRLELVLDKVQRSVLA